MEIFCLGGLVLWAFCVVLLAMVSAVGKSPKVANDNGRAGFKSERVKNDSPLKIYK